MHLTRFDIDPGITAVLTLGGVAVKSLEPMTIYTNNPGQAIKR